MWAKPSCPWQLLRLHRTFCSLCCPGQAGRDPDCWAEIRVCSSLLPCAEPFLSRVFFKAAPSWRAEEARPGQAGSAQAVPRLQTLLSSLNLQPWAEAKLVWMSLVIKVFYLSTPWQFVPVWCMRKGPSGAKPQIKCVLNEFKALNEDVS